MRDFDQHIWNEQLADDVRKLIMLAISEDLDGLGDITTQALVAEEIQGAAVIRSREPGTIAGLAAMPVILSMVDSRLHGTFDVHDGDVVSAGQTLGKISGFVASLLTAERMVLNLVGKLSGIATLTRRYVDEVAGTQARIYDTRKTTLGWRRLEKYAVRCGGGNNHRTGLFDAILIKDNHLAFGASAIGTNNNDINSNAGYTPAEAVRKARDFAALLVANSEKKETPQDRATFLKKQRSCGIQVALKNSVPQKYKSCGIDVVRKSGGILSPPLVEIEVDSLEQLAEVLPESPDIVLLDNMSPEMLRQAVVMRNAARVATELEASGGITLKNLRVVAETGVERISAGALTHAAISLDIGLDYC